MKKNTLLSFLIGVSSFAVAAPMPADSLLPLLRRADEAIEEGYPHAVKRSLKRYVEDSSLKLSLRQAALERFAQADLQTGNPKEALQFLDRIESTASLQFWKAQCLLATGRTDEAASIFLKLLENPNGPWGNEARLGASRALAQSGKTQEIETAIQLLTDMPPNAPLFLQASLELAGLLIDQNRPIDAEKVLRHIVDIPPTLQLRYSYLLARMRFQQKDYDGALLALGEVGVGHSQRVQENAVLQADCWEKLGQPEKAIDALEDYLQQARGELPSTLAFSRLDELYATQPSPSLSTLRRLASDSVLSNRTAQAILFLAKAEARVGHPREAKELYEKFLRQYPEHPDRIKTEITIASLYLLMGEYHRALSILDPLKDDAHANFLRGQVLIASGAPKEATAAFALALQDPTLRVDAIYNAAISSLLSGIKNEQNPFLALLQEEDPSGALEAEFRLADALEAARRRLPSAGDKLVDLVPQFGSRASTPLAEWYFVQLDTTAARKTLDAAPKDEKDEQRACLEVFLADDEEGGNGAKAELLGKQFLENFPNSDKALQVRLKIAEIAYRRGDYLSARAGFTQVAQESTKEGLATQAWFLAGKATAKLMSKEAVQQAMLAFEEAAKAGGELGARARFEQALLLNAGLEPQAALVLFDRVLADTRDPELRAATLIEKGDTLFSMGSANAKDYRKAMETWQELLAAPAVQRYWKEQAQTKIGLTWEKLGDADAAMESFYSVLLEKNQANLGGVWFERAGFEAGRLLETRKEWKEAAKVYQRISESGGTRAEEAKIRANRLRLEHFLWEE